MANDIYMPQFYLETKSMWTLLKILNCIVITNKGIYWDCEYREKKLREELEKDKELKNAETIPEN